MRLVVDNSLVECVSFGWCDEGKLLVYAWGVSAPRHRKGVK